MLREGELRLIAPARFAGAAKIKTQYVEMFEQTSQQVRLWLAMLTSTRVGALELPFKT